MFARGDLSRRSLGEGGSLEIRRAGSKDWKNRMAETPTAEPRPELSDSDLVRRSQMEDLHAYEQLVRRYHGRIYGFIYGMTGNRDDAAKLIQDVFARAWKALGHFHEHSGFLIWIDRIALHRTLKFCKKNKKRNPAYFEGFHSEIKQSESYKNLSSKGSVLRKLSLKEFQRKMNETLGGVSAKQRATLILHDMHRLSSLEVANVMNGTEGPARSRLAHARKKVQKAFDAQEPDVAELLALKVYERPAAARVEKSIENIMHAVRSAHKRPSLHHFPDKSLTWMFAQPRYGVAALFIIFLGLHLLKSPMPENPVGSGAIKEPVAGIEMQGGVDTNAVPAIGILAVDPVLPSLVKPEPFSGSAK